MIKNNPTPKTSTNPKGGGRIRGKKYPHLSLYPGILWEQRLGWLRMRAQARFRKEAFELSWEEFQTVWQGKWHLKGRDNTSLCLTRRDWAGVWRMDNVELVTRVEHIRKQGLAKAGKIKGPYKPRKPKNVD